MIDRVRNRQWDADESVGTRRALRIAAVKRATAQAIDLGIADVPGPADSRTLFTGVNCAPVGVGGFSAEIAVRDVLAVLPVIAKIALFAVSNDAAVRIRARRTRIRAGCFAEMGTVVGTATRLLAGVGYTTRGFRSGAIGRTAPELATIEAILFVAAFPHAASLGRASRIDGIGHD
jgi:hypothetical protein